MNLSCETVLPEDDSGESEDVDMTESVEHDSVSTETALPTEGTKAKPKRSRAKKAATKKKAVKAAAKEPVDPKDRNTKANKTRAILQEMFGKEGVTRKDIMLKLKKIPLSEPAASTYYYKYKKEFAGQKKEAAK